MEEQNSMEPVLSAIRDLINSIEDEGDQIVLINELIFEIINFGSINSYEAIGILEKAKLDYIKITDQVIDDELNDDPTN